MWEGFVLFNTFLWVCFNAYTNILDNQNMVQNHFEVIVTIEYNETVPLQHRVSFL